MPAPRPAALPALLLACACAAPRPCTRALCPTKLDGAYRVEGWSGAVVVRTDAPKVPVPPDSRVEVLSGQAEFANGAALVRAAAGTAFRFQVGLPPGPPAPVILVSSGTVEVLLSSAAAVESVPAGSACVLPAN